MDDTSSSINHMNKANKNLKESIDNAQSLGKLWFFYFFTLSIIVIIFDYMW